MTDYVYYTTIHEALYLAVIHGKVQEVQYYLQRGANVHSKNDRGVTLLCWGAMALNGNALCQLLLRYGANPNAADIEGRTPLHYAVVRGNDSVVALLLNHSKTNINALDKMHHSALYFAAREGYREIVGQLLEKGAYTDAWFKRSLFDQWFCKVPKINSTPLIESVRNRHTDIAQSLIKAGANVNAADYWNNTALHYAVSKENMPVIKALIKANAHVIIRNNAGLTPKDIVCLKNKKAVFNYLAENMKNRLGWHTSPLNTAALWLTVLNGEERLVLFMLSQMGRAKRDETRSTNYPVDLSFTIIRYLNTAGSQSMYKHLPTEVWQRISALWLQDLLSLDVDIEQMHITVGYMFSHMNDFFQPGSDTSRRSLRQNSLKC